MTTIKTLISTVALVAASTVFAQTDNTCALFPKGEDGPGVIGKRYAGAGLSMALRDENDTDRLSREGHGVGFSGNLPLCSHFDVGGSYDYFWGHGSRKQKSHTLAGSVTWYDIVDDNAKPFLRASIGVQRAMVSPTSSSSYTGVWSITAGDELSYKWISVTPTISYNDDFRTLKSSRRNWTYGVTVDSWITPNVGVYFSAEYVNVVKNHNNYWVGGIGSYVRF